MKDINDFLDESGPVQNIDIGEDKAYVTLKGDIDMQCSPEVRVAMLEVISRKIPLLHGRARLLSPPVHPQQTRDLCLFSSRVKAQQPPSSYFRVL